MHTFQTYPSDMFEIDPFTKIGSDWMLITSGNKEKANALTASWADSAFSGAKMLRLSLSVNPATPKNSSTMERHFP